MYPEEATRYLQVSRRSLCPALLEKKMLPQLLAALPRQRLTGAEIAAYCGAACPQEGAEQIFDLKAEPADGSVLEFLGRLQPAQDGALALEYLRQEGLRTGDCLVDIGSGGTTQMLLEALCQIKLQGLQLSGDGRLPGRFPDGRAQVCLAIPEKQKATYWAGQPMLERLLSEDVGATLGYTKTQGMVRAKQQQQTPEPCISALQRGAMAFVTAWKGSGRCFDPAAACDPAVFAYGGKAPESGTGDPGRPDGRGRRHLSAGSGRVMGRVSAQPAAGGAGFFAGALEGRLFEAAFAPSAAV